MTGGDKSRPTKHRFHSILVAVASAALAAFAITAMLPASSAAEDVMSVTSGKVIFNFNVSLLHDLGIDLNVVGPEMPDQADVLIQAPRWSFPILPGSDFKFRAEYDTPLPGGSIGGRVLLDGTLTLREHNTGKQTRFNDLEILQAPWPGSDATHGEDGPPLVLRSASTGLVFCQLISSMFDMRSAPHELRVHYLNARITKEWAELMGRPELAGWVIGMGEIRGNTYTISSVPPTNARYEPVFEGGFKDVSLGALSGIQSVGHVGTFPTGTAGLSMSTTSCNLGTVDVPWLAPMQIDHPTIHMGLYRLLNGRFEQVGISWLKHGFFALSNNQCSTCQHPSNGSFLGVGCSDTYAVSNNSDRNYLGPTEEVNPYTAVWNCTGSYFSGGPAFPDCVRRVGGGGVDAVQHRLVVNDADLNNAGATYYYEAFYVVRGDQNEHNNWGSRACTMSWTGSTWAFTTPGASNALLAGPALERWGDMRTYATVAAGDGQVLLGVQVTDNGNGTWHYEYSLMNVDSDRQIQSFTLPVVGVNNITNIGFHDNDTDPSTDWAVSVDHGLIHWDMTSEPLEFGYMVNFRFDADAAPTDMNSTLGIFKPGPESEVVVATRGPVNTVVGVGGTTSGLPRLVGIHPNPANRRTAIAFDLPNQGSVKLEIYDAAGRLVRTLVNEDRPAGAQSVTWDGHATNGTRVAAGVYHARLQAGGLTLARPLVMVK